MIDARDVQRTFETWLTLAKDREVLVLARLVSRALFRRGYSMRCEWVKPVGEITHPCTEGLPEPTQDDLSPQKTEGPE